MTTRDGKRPPRTSSSGRGTAAPAPARARSRKPAGTSPAGSRTQGRPLPKNRRRRRVLLVILAVFVLLLVAGGVTGCVVVNKLSAGLPDPTKPLKGTDVTTRIVDRNGATIADLFADQNRQPVALAEIPRTMREAVIATEDQRYYEHPGVDVMGLARAVVVDIRAGAQVQGGSTITQQYVKQAFVGDEMSIKRKIQEALLAYRLEKEYSKDEILAMYLNTIYFGHGSYGVQTAAKAYFNKPVQELTLAESAVLAGVIKSPGRYSPYLEPEAAVQRRDLVLGQMRDQSYIDEAAYEAAIATPIQTTGLKRVASKAPYFVEYLKEQLIKLYGEDTVYRGGLRVTATLDLTMQAAAESAIAKSLNKESDPSASLVSVDPASGEILAMVGGRDFSKQQYNVAVQGHRQSGSAFKPFVLVTALVAGVSPEQTFKADSTKLDIPGGQVWSVAGERAYKGMQRLRVATWHSLNPVFAQLVLQVGADKVVDTAKDMGIVTKITPVPAVALGGMAEGVTPLEMTTAYATLAAGGVRSEPFGILKVADKDGNVLFTAKTVQKRAIDAAVAYLTTDILKGVIQHGTASAASIGRPAAGKTGTTQNNADAWFCGYTPDLATVVWVGYADAQRPMNSVHGIRVTGGSFPAKIWAAFMKASLKGKPELQFKRPTGLVDAKICVTSGQAATTRCPKTGTGLFLTGKVPEECTVHGAPPGIPMPNLVGMTKLNALNALDALNIEYSVLSQNVPGVTAGNVAAQTPPAGSMVVTGTPVTVTVSTGGTPSNRPPIAAFTWNPATPAVNSSVHFDGSASADVDGTIQKWVWEYDDGTTDPTSGKVASHKFTTAGPHNVTLWITDSGGATVSVTKSVTVGP